MSELPPFRVHHRHRAPKPPRKSSSKTTAPTNLAPADPSTSVYSTSSPQHLDNTAASMPSSSISLTPGVSMPPFPGPSLTYTSALMRSATEIIDQGPNLFQPTSEESFEQSLMAGGYGVYRTMEWSGNQSPVTVKPPPSDNPPAQPPPVVELSSRELRKRARLSAFFPSISIPSTSSHHTTTVDSTSSTAVSRGRPRAGPSSPSKTRKKRLEEDTRPSITLERRPNWPDDEFPWAMRLAERRRWLDRQREENLKWIEKYLESQSEDDLEDEELDGSISQQSEYDPHAPGGIYNGFHSRRIDPFSSGSPSRDFTPRSVTQTPEPPPPSSPTTIGPGTTRRASSSSNNSPQQDDAKAALILTNFARSLRRKRERSTQQSSASPRLV